jgi:ferric hydroxamate transport system substrate-binding protein
MRLGAAAACAAAIGSSDAAATAQQRVVSLDYGLTTTLLAIGITPVAVADAADWPVWVVEPALPDSVVDIGDDLAVNLELLSTLSPDIILSTPYLEASRPALMRLAPVEVFSIYAAGGRPLARSIEATRQLGHLLGRIDAARQFLARTEAAFDAHAARLRRLDVGPLALVNLMDARHARVFGAHSLYQDVMDRIGLTNAWTGPTNDWGFQTIAIEQLGLLHDAYGQIIAFEPLPPDALPTLRRSPLWNALPAVAAGRFSLLPGVLMFGMVPAALRFSELIVSHLESQAT